MASIRSLPILIVATVFSVAALAQESDEVPVTPAYAERWELDSLGVEWVNDVSSLDLATQSFVYPSGTGSRGSIDLESDGSFVREHWECGTDRSCSGEWHAEGGALTLLFTECRGVDHLVEPAAEPYYVVRRLDDRSLLLIPGFVATYVEARGGMEYLRFFLDRLAYRASP